MAANRLAFAFTAAVPRFAALNPAKGPCASQRAAILKLLTAAETLPARNAPSRIGSWQTGQPFLPVSGVPTKSRQWMWCRRVPSAAGHHGGLIPMVFFRLQLRDTPLERANLLLGSSKILVIEHADFLAIRSLAHVGPVIRYVNHVVC
jgi:hypothetical protein